MNPPDLSHTPETRPVWTPSKKDYQEHPFSYLLSRGSAFSKTRSAHFCTECGHFYDPKISKVCVSKLAKSTVL